MNSICWSPSPTAPSPPFIILPICLLSFVRSQTTMTLQTLRKPRWPFRKESFWSDLDLRGFGGAGIKVQKRNIPSRLFSDRNRRHTDEVRPAIFQFLVFLFLFFGGGGGADLLSCLFLRFTFQWRVFYTFFLSFLGIWVSGKDRQILCLCCMFPWFWAKQKGSSKRFSMRNFVSTKACMRAKGPVEKPMCKDINMWPSCSMSRADKTI